MNDNLIDEYIIPIRLDDGVKLFKDEQPEQKLKLLSTKQCNKGLVQLHYKRA